jgi:RND superfamily putative drug exporter
MGFGLAVAVLIDATIIRGVLLPASMKVLGDWNWYLPKWLEWLPPIGGRDAAPPVTRKGPPSPDGPGAAEEPKPTPLPA